MSEEKADYDDECSSLLSSAQRKWLAGGEVGTPDRIMRNRIKSRYKQAAKDYKLMIESDVLDTKYIDEWEENLNNE